MSSTDVHRSLVGSPIFAGIADASIENLCAGGQTISFSAGHVLFERAEDARGLSKLLLKVFPFNLLSMLKFELYLVWVRLRSWRRAAEYRNQRNLLVNIGAGNTGTWFSGSPPYGGCAAGSGYLNYLAADDDNGNINDGTPHMTAIFDAFDDQEIACNTPAVQDSGCSGTPTQAPSVSALLLDKSASLSWNAVANASSYEVFRTDGVFGCDFGKVRIGETVGTSFNDSGLQNGRSYSYVVIPKGSADSCFGSASSCTAVTPLAGPNIDIDPASIALGLLSGDGDPFIDNCEEATLTFDINNTGLGRSACLAGALRVGCQ